MAEHGFHHVYFHKEPAKAQRPWFGQIYFGRTTWYTHYCETPEDAAKAADRYVALKTPLRMQTECLRGSWGQGRRSK